MGDLIHLSERVADRSRPSRGPAAFFFALGCPISYLAAETVERALGDVEWIPVLSQPARAADRVAWMSVAEREACALRLPLIAPEDPCADPRPLTRAAIYAADHGAGARFGLAANRMIFCGGFDADDPTVIVEGAAAAGLAVEAALEAAWDFMNDESLDATVRGLQQRGVSSAPAIRIGGRWFAGLEAVSGASSYTVARATYGAPQSAPEFPV